MNLLRLRTVLAVKSLLLLFSAAVCAGTHTWKGGSNQNYWTVAANWVEGQPPNLDANPPVILVFPASAQSYTTVCNMDFDFLVDKMIFRAGYTVKYDDFFDGKLGLRPGTGDKLVIESAASPTVIFDSSVSFVMGGSQSGTIRLQSGHMKMQGRFISQSQNNSVTRLEGDGSLHLDCQDGARGSFTVKDNTILYLASPPGSNLGPAPPFNLTVEGNGAVVVQTDDQLEGSPVSIDSGGLSLDTNVSDTVGTVVLSNYGRLFASNPGAELGLNDTITCPGGSAAMHGNFLLNGANRAFKIAPAGDLKITGSLNDGTGEDLGLPSSTGGIRKIGPGSMIMDCSGYYHGPLLVDEGLVFLVNPAAAGAPGGGVSVADDGTLILVSGSISGETLTLAGTLNVAETVMTWAGPVILQSTARPVSIQPGSALNIAGPVSGPGALMTLAGGTLELSGNTANTYAGDTLIRGGVLKLSKTSGNAVPGDLEINTLITGLDAKVALTYDNQIANSSLIQLGGAAVLDLASHSDTVGGLMSFGNGQPEVRLGNSRTGSATFTVGTNNQNTNFYGRISGVEEMTLQKAGTGLLTLGTWGGINTYEGLTRVLGGVLDVKSPQQIGPVVVDTGTWLKGTGTVGAVTLNGGYLRTEHLKSGSVAGNLSGGKILADLLDAAPRPGGYDQLRVSGTVTLTGTTFLGGLAFQPQTGARFVIIRNDGTDAVTGQFTGLPEGGGLSIGGKPFSISYHGGDGNDVELKYLGTGGPPRILTIGYNRILDRVHLEAVAPPGVLCQWQVSSGLGIWSNFAAGTPDAAGLLELDQTTGLHADRLFFRLVQP